MPDYIAAHCLLNDQADPARKALSTPFYKVGIHTQGVNLPRNQQSGPSDSCFFVFNPKLVFKCEHVVGSMMCAMLQKILSYPEKVQSDGEGITSTYIHSGN